MQPNLGDARMAIERKGPNEIGQNISLAMRIIDETFHQIVAFFARLDILMAQRGGFFPIRKNRVGMDPTLGIGSVANWLPRRFFRAYMTADPKKGPPQDRVLAFEIALLPEDLDEPAILGVALQLKHKVKREDVWKEWREGNGFFGSVPVNRADKAPIEFSEAMLAEVFSPAARGNALCIPLATLTDRNLAEKLVKPCCDMFHALAAPLTPSDVK